MCLVLAGIFVAQLINYGTKEIYPWGWRLSLGLGGIPGIMLFVGALLLPDTPNSLIERGKLERGEKVLQRIRGTKGRSYCVGAGQLRSIVVHCQHNNFVAIPN